MAKEPRKLPSDRSAKVISRIYQRLTEELEKLIVVAVNSPRIKESRFLQAQRTQIINLLNQAQAQSTPLIAAIVRDSYIGGAQRGRQWIEAFIGLKSKTVFSAADQAAIELIADGTVSRLSDGLSVVGRRADDILRNASLQELQAVARVGAGDQLFEAATDKLETALISSNLTTTGSVANQPGQIGMRLININGRNYDPGYYSEMVVRTESRKADSQAVLNQFTENDWDLVQVTSHSTSCDICGEFDGNKYSITGNTPGYDILPETPPFHPNCRHLLTGVLE